MISWFDSSEATGVGVALADDVSSTLTARVRRLGTTQSHNTKEVQRFLQQVETNAASLRLNLYKKAKLASSFKLKLLENRVDEQLAEDLTQLLLMHLSVDQTKFLRQDPAISDGSVTIRAKRSDFQEADRLFAEGTEQLRQSDPRKAANTFQKMLRLMPGNADGLNGLGSALWQLSCYREAETYLRQAVEARPNHAETLNNLGTVHLARGEYYEAQAVLRRAIKAQPTFVVAQTSLGYAYLGLGCTSDAQTLYTKVLRSAPRDAEALVGMGQIAKLHGRFDEAHAYFTRALESKPRMCVAWAALADIRKMTTADQQWLKRAEELLCDGVSAQEEAGLRFAMGKYFDDVGRYDRAFQNYKRANELSRAVAPKYDHEARTRLVDDFIGVYTRERLSQVPPSDCSSNKAVFVVGMVRSGTSLVEQIIATHASAVGAGELSFWNDAFLKHQAEVRTGILGEATRLKLAQRYLRTLKAHDSSAQVIVDKANANADYLGLIHTVLPAARFILVRRHPIDTCLSSYFQSLAPSFAFKTDLSDLAHYYREHERLMRHWRAVLPPGTLLEVPYADLVDQPEQWTRRMLEFVGLDWQPQCLNFHQTDRPVKTASAWQVRQKLYRSSVGRWRNYERYIGPLRDFADQP